MAETGGTSTTTLTPAGPAARFVLHAADATMAALSQAYGLGLPATINCAVGKPDARAALKLGPDEWLLIAVGEPSADIAASLNAASSGIPISLVEVSDRQIGLTLAGPQAALALNAGVPLDLSLETFPVGMATRTIFEKAEIVLWRTGPENFRIEVWRSFAPYVQEMLAIALRENAAAP